MVEFPISANDARIQSTASAGQTIFPYDFPIFDEADVKVYKTDGVTDVTTLLTITTHYTVSGVDEENGGNITLTSGATLNDIYTRVRSVPAERVTDFQIRGNFRARLINRELDLQAMMIQELTTNYDRTPTLAVEAPALTSMDLPPPNATAKSLLMSTAGFTLGATADEIVNAQGYAVAADASATAAATSETNAGTSETNAANSAAAAAASAAEGLYAEIVVVTFAESPLTITGANEGDFFKVDTSGGAVVINLPDLSGEADDFRCGIMKETVDANAVTVNRQGTDTINGGTSVTITAQYQTTNFIGDQSTLEWSATDATAGTALIATQNLADLDNVATARNNLGLGTAALLNTGTGDNDLPDMADLKPYLGKNKIINGGFDIVQRGVSFADPNVTYMLDRWLGVKGTGGAATVTQETFTLGQTDVAGNPKYFLRFDQTTNASTQPRIEQRIEGVETFAGETMTVSFDAKVDAGTLALTTQTIQNFGTGGSPSSQVIKTESAETLTTSFQRFEIAITLASISGKTLGTNGDDYLSLKLMLPTGDTYAVDIANVQIEAGSVATNFEQELISQTLAKCKWYFERQGGAAVQESFASGFQTATTNVRLAMQYKIKRTTPSIAANAVDAIGLLLVGSAPSSTAISFSDIGIQYARVDATISAAGAQGNGATSRFNVNDYIDIDAEL